MEVLDAPGGVAIIGAGIAGLWTALRLAPHPALVISAGALGTGSSAWAQGGIAAALGSDDSTGAHLQDTLNAGSGLVREDAARFLCERGPGCIERLAAYGIPFDRTEDGHLALGREAAHQHARIVHVGGDEAGAAIMRRLMETAQTTPSITLRGGMIAERLLTDDNGVAGFLAWEHERRRQVIVRARTVVLATGGIGGLFAVTTNPLYSLGHGLALAGEAGATLRDLEFVQFHPTALVTGRDPAPLATEAIRGEGGVLIDREGRRFMRALHPDAELAPRDVVARGVAAAVKAGGAFLDASRSLGRDFAARFPTVDEAAKAAGFDAATTPLPVAPAAHYHMGGVRTDLQGRSDVDGLFAVGECASSGVHGANRLASNSLLEAAVFGEEAAETIKGSWRPSPASVTARDDAANHGPPQSIAPLRRAMTEDVSILRSEEGLGQAAAEIDRFEPETLGERLAVSAAAAVVRAAAAREESRGSHFRTDHPHPAPTAQHSLTRWSSDGWSVTFEDKDL